MVLQRCRQATQKGRHQSIVACRAEIQQRQSEDSYLKGVQEGKPVVVQALVEAVAFDTVVPKASTNMFLGGPVQRTVDLALLWTRRGSTLRLSRRSPS